MVSATLVARMDHGALVIGIAHYANVNPLPDKVLADAREVERALTDADVGLYAPSNVRRLAEHEATRAGILEALRELSDAAGEASTVLLYFSGHGGSIEASLHAGRYLLPVDVDASSEAALTASAITGEELTGWLRGLRASRALVILDCCNAGGIGAPKAISPAVTLPAFRQGFSATDYGALIAGQDRVILAAARSEEVSWVLQHDENSLFTKHLLGGLRGKAALRADGITLFDLYDYVQRMVVQEGARQHPVFKGELGANFVVARSPAGAPPLRPDAYDAYVSFAREDEAWVYDVLISHLESRGLRIVTSDSDAAGIGGFRVASVARGIEHSKRTVVVLSKAYLRDNYGRFETLLAMQVGLDKAQVRLVPLVLGRADALDLPILLSGLVNVEYGHPRHGGAKALEKVSDAIRATSPLP